MISQISIWYIGYHDRTFVPFRCLPGKGDIYGGNTEEQVKANLCITQKIGNGALSCSNVLLMEDTIYRRYSKKIKRNHYFYKIVSRIETEDADRFSRVIERKLGLGPTRSLGSTDVSDAPTCEHGFCD